jgi:hypothetical protein
LNKSALRRYPLSVSRLSGVVTLPEDNIEMITKPSFTKFPLVGGFGFPLTEKVGDE